MKKKKKAKAKAGNKHRSEMHKDELTYFLDHPDIHREPCIGNGSSPGSLPSSNVTPSQVRSGGLAGNTASTGRPSIASQINFGGKK